MSNGYIAGSKDDHPVRKQLTQAYFFTQTDEGRKVHPQWQFTYLWLAGNEGMEKKMETTIMGYVGTSIRIQSFIPGQPKVSSRFGFRVQPMLTFDHDLWALPGCEAGSG